ncbi:hypothetical protein GALMADRAFT_215808 [Galerina marginata CBS 339.88]|uniref:Uncharacterized protein n=1 Tax=Galerina marginata (strain CBS 339.88) TaxID=685588 RepID=A0A067SEF0_GALM3|nr:hypothetical protein GALMADRAFT_215808 [Galerina marginata CBS 339.88]
MHISSFLSVQAACIATYSDHGPQINEEKIVSMSDSKPEACGLQARSFLHLTCWMLGRCHCSQIRNFGFRCLEANIIKFQATNSERGLASKTVILARKNVHSEVIDPIGRGNWAGRTKPLAFKFSAVLVLSEWGLKQRFSESGISW